MKKQLTLLSLGLILASSTQGFSQEGRLIKCNTDEMMEDHFRTDPAARVRYEAIQGQIRSEFLERSQNLGANKTAAVVYTVPVVFHILHQGGPENVTDAQCIAALQQVNDDYARLGSDTNQIAPSFFKTRYVDSEIKFMLAKKDPQGNCITGIVRHVDPKTQWLQASAQNSPGYWPYTWNPTQYLNIYIVANIVPQTTVVGGGIIGGYTYRPGTWPILNARDAIVYRYSLLSGPPNNDARSLSHEIGHWLNLPHTFGNTNNPGVSCGDDALNDTPVTKGNYNACPPAFNNPAVVCANNLTQYWQNSQNIMDYSNCPLNFTQDQTTSMRTTLVTASVGRSNLSTASNLGTGFTDVNGLGICSPIAEFLSTTNNYTVCSGGSITMKSFSYNGTITGYQWTTNNNTTIVAPSSSITLITFNTVGITSVTLTVSNSLGSSSKVRTVTVINGTPGITGPYSESFEGPGLPVNWMSSVNPANGVDWQQSPDNASYDGLKSYYMEGANSIGGQISYLQMPTMNLLNNQGAIFTFAYSYARLTSTHNDVFRVQMSKDCGGSWTDVLTKSATVMNNEIGELTTTPFLPTSSANDWKVIDLTQSGQWNLFTSSPSVWLRFAFEEAPAGGGNNFFLDAINFTGGVGINELEKNILLSLYPNPTTGEAQLNFTLSDASDVKVNVVDLLGKDVLPALSYHLGTGEQNIVINKNQTLSKGVYLVNLSLNGTKMSRKLVIH